MAASVAEYKPDFVGGGSYIRPEKSHLALDGKHIVPTERGLALFDVLERADPALVDPGVTA